MINDDLKPYPNTDLKTQLVSNLTKKAQRPIAAIGRRKNAKN